MNPERFRATVRDMLDDPSISDEDLIDQIREGLDCVFDDESDWVSPSGDPILMAEADSILRSVVAEGRSSLGSPNPLWKGRA